jgi:hypothetical protein
MLREGMSLGDARELNDGWYFPFRSRERMGGCNGVIVNKRSGKLFHLGSAFPPNRDLDLYDRGYQFDCYDLTILSVRDRAQTLNALSELRLSVVENAQKLDQLPCVVPAVRLYFVAEVLENARRAGWFTFEIREHVPPLTPTSPPAQP